MAILLAHVCQTINRNTGHIVPAVNIEVYFYIRHNKTVSSCLHEFDDVMSVEVFESSFRNFF